MPEPVLHGLLSQVHQVALGRQGLAVAWDPGSPEREGGGSRDAGGSGSGAGAGAGLSRRRHGCRNRLGGGELGVSLPRVFGRQRRPTLGGRFSPAGERPGSRRPRSPRGRRRPGRRARSARPARALGPGMTWPDARADRSRTTLPWGSRASTMPSVNITTWSPAASRVSPIPSERPGAVRAADLPVVEPGRRTAPSPGGAVGDARSSRYRRMARAGSSTARRGDRTPRPRPASGSSRLSRLGDLVQRALVAEMRPHQRPERRHDQRGGEVVARDVGHHHADPAAREGNVVVVIAADAQRSAGQSPASSCPAIAGARSGSRRSWTNWAVRSCRSSRAASISRSWSIAFSTAIAVASAKKLSTSTSCSRRRRAGAVALEVQGADRPAVEPDRHRDLGDRRGPPPDVPRVEPRVARAHGLAAANHVPHDAPALLEHGIGERRPGREAPPADPGDLLAQRPRSGRRHLAAQHEDAAGVVGDDQLEPLEQTVQRLAKVEACREWCGRSRAADRQRASAVSSRCPFAPVSGLIGSLRMSAMASSCFLTPRGHEMTPGGGNVSVLGQRKDESPIARPAREERSRRSEQPALERPQAEGSATTM